MIIFRSGGCSSLAFSSCGKAIASGYWDGSIRIHSVNNATILAFVNFHYKSINFIYWENVLNCRLLFVCSNDCTISVWNLFKD